MNSFDPIVNVEKPLAVTIKRARALSGLGHTTLWKLISDGELETARVGRRRLVIYRSLERLLQPPTHEAA